MAKIEVGDVFTNNKGCSATVIRYVNNKNITIKFHDEYAYEMITNGANLTIGSFKNPYHPIIFGVGIFGVGKYRAMIGRKDTKEYTVWRHMIGRCYSENLSSKNLSYKDCTVCPEWHNFQNFAEWYVNHEFYGMGYQIDKDILVRGNKVYSPETCTLVPHEINTMLCDNPTKRGCLPIGVCYAKDRGKYGASVMIEKRKKHLGFFMTADEASSAYAVAKSDYIVLKSIEYREVIEHKVFVALNEIARKMLVR